MLFPQPPNAVGRFILQSDKTRALRPAQQGGVQTMKRIPAVLLALAVIFLLGGAALAEGGTYSASHGVVTLSLIHI